MPGRQNEKNVKKEMQHKIGGGCCGWSFQEGEEKGQKDPVNVRRRIGAEEKRRRMIKKEICII